LTLRPAASFTARPAWFIAVKASKSQQKRAKTEENLQNSQKIFK
jgi:hypothetical protein